MAKETDDISGAGELTFTDILRALYRRKWIIGGATLLVGVIAAAVVLRMENSYSASASLIMRTPSPDVTTQNPMIADIEALYLIANSMEVQSVAYQKLIELGALDSQMPFEAFVKHLRSELGLRRDQRATPLPVLILSAHAGAPDRAALMANCWADVLIQRVRDIYTDGIRKDRDFAETVYRTATNAYDDFQDAYTSQTLAPEYTFTRALQKQQHARATGLYEKTIKLREDIATAAARMRVVRTRLADERTPEGNWIGDAFYLAYRDGQTVATDSHTTATRQLARLMQQTVQKEKELAAVEYDSVVAGMPLELAAALARLEENLAEFAVVEGDFEVLKRKAAAFAEAVEKTPAQVVLRKAITDDAAWMAHIEGKLKSPDALPLLRTEEMNPVHYSLKEAQALNDVEMQGMEKKREHMIREQAQLKERIETFQNRISRADREIEILKAAVAALAQQVAKARSEFHALEQERAALEREMRVKQADLESFETELALVLPFARSLGERLVAEDRQMRALKRDMDGMQAVSTAHELSANRLTLRLRAADKDAYSLIDFLFRAEGDPRRVAPNRKKSVLAAMALAFIALSALVVVAEMLERSSGRRPS